MENQTDPMKIALETLTERCKQLEQRVNDVEGENTRLRLVCSKVEDTKQDSLNEIDLLKQRNTQLREQNTQLKNNIQMVASENRQLWSKLSSLSEVNQTLGKKISKINSSLIEHSNKITTEPSQTQLIRSKTFTQNEPYLKYQQNNVVDEGNKISLELEDISLKLITSIVKEKYELQAQCNEMMELQSEEVNSMFGFAYPGDDLEESVLDNLEKHINDLKSIKQNVQLERQVILNNITAMKNITGILIFFIVTLQY